MVQIESKRAEELLSYWLFTLVGWPDLEIGDGVAAPGMVAVGADDLAVSELLELMEEDLVLDTDVVCIEHNSHQHDAAGAEPLAREHPALLDVLPTNHYLLGGNAFARCDKNLYYYKCIHL